MDDKTYTMSAVYIDPDSVPNIDICRQFKAERDEWRDLARRFARELNTSPFMALKIANGHTDFTEADIERAIAPD